jgi:WhiB family transcriptional regulator, redox-sensing transcriptional regulator
MSLDHYADIVEEDDLPTQEPTDPYYRIQLPLLAVPEVDWSWRQGAECLESGVDFFSMKPSAIAAAKVVCSRCDVSGRCLEFSIVNNEKWGIWGGLDEDERRPLLPRGRR